MYENHYKMKGYLLKLQGDNPILGAPFQYPIFTELGIFVYLPFGEMTFFQSLMPSILYHSQDDPRIITGLPHHGRACCSHPFDRNYSTPNALYTASSALW